MLVSVRKAALLPGWQFEELLGLSCLSNASERAVSTVGILKHIMGSWAAESYVMRS